MGKRHAPPATPRDLRFAAVAAVLVGVIVAIVAIVSANQSAAVERRFEVSGRVSNGIVSEVDPGNHGWCAYKFDAGGVVFHRSQFGCPDGVRLRATVSVYYFPNHPNESTLNTPHSTTANNYLTAVFFPPFAAAFAFIAVLATAQLIRKRRDEDRARLN